VCVHMGAVCCACLPWLTGRSACMAGHEAGISLKAVKLRPIAVIKG
jgi:hypothetical protein